MPSPRLTLKDVARAAGVSVATASQALRNDANNSRATCARVQAVARELGYRPDPLLARLAARRFHRTRSLSQAPVMFVTGEERNPGQPHHRPRYENELRDSLGKLGYAYRHARVADKEELRQAARRWWHQGVRGVIFGMFDHAEWLAGMDWSAFSVMFVGGRIQRNLFHTVKADAAEQAKLAIDTLVQNVPSGKIGVMLHRHSPELPDDLLREGVARTLLSRLPARRRTPLHFDTFGLPYDGQVTRMRQWMLRHRPSAVAGMSIAQTQARDAGFPNIPFFAINRDEGRIFVGATEPVGEEARRAAEWIDGMIRHGERGLPELPLRILVPSRWHSEP